MDEVMIGVEEYEEELEVKLGYEKSRPTIVAFNESGYCCTSVDLIQVLGWVRVNKPELIQREWVGLTDDEIKAIIGHNHPEGIGSYARELFKQIEDKLREKNG